MNRSAINIALVFALAATAATVPVQANDQSAHTDVNTTAAPSLQGTQVTAAAKPKRPPGPLAPLAKRLAQHGVYLRANLVNQYADATTGGVEQGHTNVGQFNIGADVDLDKAWGLSGGSFHFTVYRDYGHGLNHDLSGTFTKQQYIYKNEYTRWHLGLFAYEQKALDGKLDIVVGRLGTTSYYAHLVTNCQFQAGTVCGVPRLINSEAGYSLLPSATWAVNVRYRPTPHTYVESGVYEVNPTTSASNGLDFSIANANGITVPVEFGYAKTDLATTRYPFELKIGGYVSTAPRSDPYYNTKGQSRGLYGGVARQVNGSRDGIYLMGDRVVWRPDPSRNENINVFAGVSQQLEQTEIMRQQIYGGFVWTGPFRSRSRDTIGFSASYFNLAPREVEYLRDARIKAGGSGSNNPREMVYELNYGLQVARGIELMPNVQYIVHPDNSGIPKTPVLPKNLFAFGLNLKINLGGALGFMSAPKGDD
ncbi:carbohydrate porin [Rhodanobacter sp. Col0626]|uniref:carbohydrate porin n=1 Tax=Rhodanobacter sp. Col0626 TaxID=3415679 RepID=UPI003CED8D42